MNHLTGVYCCMSIKHLKVREKGGKKEDFKSSSAKRFTQGLLHDGEDLNPGASDGFRWQISWKEAEGRWSQRCQGAAGCSPAVPVRD